MNALLIADIKGLGHRIRCGALAEELRRRGWGTNIEVEACAPETNDKRYDVCVYDGTHFDPGLHAWAKKLVRIIDDPSQARDCDLIVMGSADAEVGRAFEHVDVKVLAGPEYSLLRSQFRDTPPFVRMGISDVREVAGRQALDLANHMAGAQVLITYGGMRAMEAACVGAPSVIVPRNRGERRNALGLAMAGAAIISTEGEAFEVAQHLLPVKPLLNRMSDKAQRLVDGRGCERVADAIEGMFR